MHTTARFSLSYAEQATEQVHLSERSNAVVAPAAAADPRVRVFDNALLDKLFTKDRAAHKRENRKLDEFRGDQSLQQPPAISAPPLLLPNDSFAAKITPRTPSTLAAALRFAEQGRREIKSQRYLRAVNYLERAVSVGVRNYLPYIYYYLAQTHYHLANYQSASNFLEAAEAWLSDHSAWITPIAALRQDNVNAMGYARASSGSKTQ
jgi:tetratricopeptide (TPR) repeat protein